MTGDEGRLVRESEVTFLFEGADNCKADGHDRGLRVLGERQILLRTFPHQLREVLAERLVHLAEDFARRSERLREFAAHSDRLRSLSRKGEGPRHPRSLLTVSPQRPQVSGFFVVRPRPVSCAK